MQAYKIFHAQGQNEKYQQNDTWPPSNGLACLHEIINWNVHVHAASLSKQRNHRGNQRTWYWDYIAKQQTVEQPLFQGKSLVEEVDGVSLTLNRIMKKKNVIT